MAADKAPLLVEETGRLQEHQHFCEVLYPEQAEVQQIDLHGALHAAESDHTQRFAVLVSLSGVEPRPDAGPARGGTVVRLCKAGNPRPTSRTLGGCSEAGLESTGHGQISQLAAVTSMYLAGCRGEPR